MFQITIMVNCECCKISFNTIARWPKLHHMLINNMIIKKLTSIF